MRPGDHMEEQYSTVGNILYDLYARNSKSESRDLKARNIKNIRCFAFATILCICGAKVRLLSNVTPRSLTSLDCVSSISPMVFSQNSPTLHLRAISKVEHFEVEIPNCQV